MQVPAGLLQVIPLSDLKRANVQSPADARRGFGATLAVAGSVRRLDDGLRVSFEVVDPQAGVGARARSTGPGRAGALLQDRVAPRDRRRARARAAPRAACRAGPAADRAGSANTLVLQGRGRLLDAGIRGGRRCRAPVRQATAQDPAHAPAWAGLGDASWAAYLLTKEPAWIDSARTSLDRAVRLDPALAEAHTGLGDLDQGTGFPELAITEYKRAIALDPTGDAAFRGLATSYHALGRDADAETAFREAIARHPDYWGGYSHLGNFYLREARYPESLAMLRRVTELAPLNARGWSNLEPRWRTSTGRRRRSRRSNTRSRSGLRQ